MELKLADLFTKGEFAEYIKGQIDRAFDVSEKSKRCSHIEIKTRTEIGGMFTEVFVDGHRLNGVRRFKLKHGDFRKPPTLTVDLNALDISVDCPAILCQEGEGDFEIRFRDSTGTYGSPDRHFFMKKLSEKTGLSVGEIADYVSEEWEKELGGYCE